MKLNIEQLELKLKDYRRFTATLLILASYLYMGAIINTYIRQSPDGSSLTLLAFATTFVAGWLIYHSHRLKIKIQENERV
ncbi:YrhC-like protein [Virgibacillus subterraneus]|uniref:YrhC-like protein n=2 Tax=Virgibacillus TaxID=84406 RepID=A0A1H1B730_9BACI|nr:MULTISPECIES: YrhC family protein [Virgibacillus]SDQ47702.1 YrhC-like protein [Virgibacillus salinus]SEQ16414.1 YrhC-like protein [Virgibacillus subterraneus]